MSSLKVITEEQFESDEAVDEIASNRFENGSLHHSDCPSPAQVPQASDYAPKIEAQATQIQSLKVNDLSK